MICACGCRTEFEPKQPSQKYSSPECKERARRRRFTRVRVTAEEHKLLDRARIAQTAAGRGGDHPFPGYRSIRPQQSRYGPLTLLDEHEVSELLGISVGTLRFWRRRKERRVLPFVKIGVLVRYRLQDLEHYLAKHRVRTGAAREGRRQTKAAGK